MKFQNIFSCLKENSCENLIWLINFLPYIGGFPLLTRKSSVLFWIIHAALVVYVYIVGVYVYEKYYADDLTDAIKGFCNLYVLMIIVSAKWWILRKRNDLNDILKLVKENDNLAVSSRRYDILKLVKENDNLAVSSGRYLDKYKKLLRNIKIAILVWYIFQFINDIVIFIPVRTFGMEYFATANCVGLEPLTSSPNWQICWVILAAQQLTSIVVVVTYDVILLFLFAHTTSIYLILTEEMKNFQQLATGYDGAAETSSTIAEYLKEVVIRHSLVLYTVSKMQNIYSATIGLTFGLAASFFCLFFTLPFEVCQNFIPLGTHYLFISFLYCLLGQRLTNASEKFETEVYCCGWEKLHYKDQKYVLLILKASQRPVVLHAARMIPINMHTFANTIQAVYKFTTVFKA